MSAVCTAVCRSGRKLRTFKMSCNFIAVINAVRVKGYKGGLLNGVQWETDQEDDQEIDGG